MEIVNIKVEEIKPYEQNPRFNDHAVEKVANSIKEFGIKQPLVVDENNVLIVGHTRLKAMQQLGIKEAPCIVASDLTEEQAKAYRLADNKTNEFADWDFGLLNIELEELELDFDMSDFGFEDVFDDMELDQVQEDDYEVELHEEPISKRGDIWLLGKHRLMCGDSTKEDDVAKLMNGDKVDLFITDPPYNVDYTGKTKDALKIENDKKDDASFRQFLVDAFSTADAVMREGAAFYIWHSDSEGYNFRGACFDIGWEIRQCLIWVKNSLVMGRQDYHWKHEPCLYGWKEGAAHLWASDRKQTTVLNFDRPTRNAEHPTKVDRSGAYKAREIAKQVLLDKDLKWCEVQLSYAIGKDKPLSIYIDSDKGKIAPAGGLYIECKPKNIIQDLNLKSICYEETACFGHFQ